LCIKKAGKNLKPYQGLKQHELGIHRNAIKLLQCSRKKPKTLSGIETNTAIPQVHAAFLAAKPEKT
jgi:hypothetical protein